MEVPLWYGVPDKVIMELNAGVLCDKENYIANRSNPENTDNMGRLPLREITQTQSNIQSCQFTKFEGGIKVNSDKFHNGGHKHHPVNISIRNERERNRVKLLNLGFERLRAVVPHNAGEQLSKISTLKNAIWYIEHLDRVLHGPDHTTSGVGSSSKDTAGVPTPQSSSVSGTGRTAQQLRKSRRDHRASIQHQSSSPQTTSGDPMEASNSHRSGSLAPGTTSWTTLPQKVTKMQNNATQSCSKDCNPNSNKDKQCPVKEQGPLSPIFPKQWGSMYGEYLTPTKNNGQYKVENQSDIILQTKVADYTTTKTAWLNSSQFYDSGYESPTIGPECRIVR